jgi:hypothetical protein
MTYAEDQGDTYLKNTGKWTSDYTVLHPKTNYLIVTDNKTSNKNFKYR